MAVEAVASVVIQKLTDMLTEESITHQKVIVDQLQKIKRALERMEGYAEEKQETDEQVKDYLDHLYDVEDTIETFALRFARQRKRLGFLMNHALFLKNFTACGNLTRKIRRIRKHIHKLNRKRQGGTGDASINSTIASINSTFTSPSFNLDSTPPALPPTANDGEIPRDVTRDQKEEEQEAANDGEIPRDVTRDQKEEEEEAAAAAAAAEAEEERDKVGELQTEHPHLKSTATAKSMLRHSASSPKLEVPTAFTSRDPYTSPEGRLTPQSARSGFRALSDASVLTEHLGQPRPMLNLRTQSAASVYAERLGQHKFMSSFSFDEEELDIVGFKEDVRVLVETLTQATSTTTTQVVSLVGPTGSGKTTLARAVFGNRKIKECFKSCTAWATVCKDCNQSVDLLHKLLKQVGNPKVDRGALMSTDEQALKSRLCERLKDKKYLIVLDDFGSFEMWSNMEKAFPDKGNGSKILLITSQKVEEEQETNISSHEVKTLSTEDSWALFQKKAGFQQCPENLKEQILQVCSCLPLNIVLLGSLLSTKKDDGEYRDILSRQPNWETKDIISVSYSDLPVHLKLCLLYTVLFPREFDIPVRRLLRLWLAEGFVKRPDKSSSFQEDVVKEYFDELVKRSLIQVSKLTSDGSPKRCRLLGVLHDFLMPKAKVISLFHVHEKSDTCKVEGQFGARRLVQRREMKVWDASQLESLRSYLSFNTQYGDTPAKEVGILLRNIIGSGSRLLRVLDLEGVYKPSLPENLGDLFHLRYLGLRWTFLDALPKSVGKLHYLEALDIKHTYIDTLPTFIWKLKRLKHLNANGIRLDLPSGHSLPQLLTLWGFSVDDESLVKDGLNSLLHLRELGITFNLSNSEALLEWISKLKEIQTLRLRSKDDAGRPSQLILKPLSSLKQLTMLNLLGKLQELRVDYFPKELKVVTLSCSQLTNDPMPILGELPNLTVLRLLAESYLGETMVCPQGGFKQLRALKLWKLKNLKQWDVEEGAVEEGAMERLKELNIRCCDLLETIPCRLLQQRSLKELTLTNMPAKFREQVKETKSPHVALIVKEYKFSPLPWEGADDDSSDGVYSMSNNHNGHMMN